jgi:hypothetical protein
MISRTTAPLFVARCQTSADATLEAVIIAEPKLATSMSCIAPTLTTNRGSLTLICDDVDDVFENCAPQEPDMGRGHMRKDRRLPLVLVPHAT